MDLVNAKKMIPMQLQNVIATKIILGTFVNIVMKIMMEFMLTQKALVILNPYPWISDAFE